MGEVRYFTARLLTTAFDAYIYAVKKIGKKTPADTSGEPAFPFSLQCAIATILIPLGAN